MRRSPHGPEDRQSRSKRLEHGETGNRLDCGAPDRTARQWPCSIAKAVSEVIAFGLGLVDRRVAQR